MKRFIAAAVVAVVALVGMAPKADAQFKFGPKVGLCVNSMHFNQKLLDSDNRAGLTAGLMAEFKVPLIGIGCDLSALYVRRNSRYMAALEYHEGAQATIKADYLDIPLNIKYHLPLPAISKIFSPFITTGPDFAFRLSKETVSDVVNVRNFDFAWNFGFGVELFSHLQLAASYGLGLNGALEFAVPKEAQNTTEIKGKNRYWTVTAAYLF